MVNKQPTTVRKQARGTDRRVRQTHRALVEALVALVLEKSYRAITVRDLLDRAKVGRSTFYGHFRGKDDLLFRSFETMIAGAVERQPLGSTRIVPAMELFHHVGGMAEFHRRLVRAGFADRLMAVGTRALAGAIEPRMAASDGDPPAPVAAHAVAGMVFALMGWWVAQDVRPRPEQMDRWIHEMVQPGRPGAAIDRTRNDPMMSPWIAGGNARDQR